MNSELLKALTDLADAVWAAQINASEIDDPRMGGNTTCMAYTHGDDHALRTLVLRAREIIARARP